MFLFWTSKGSRHRKCFRCARRVVRHATETKDGRCACDGDKNFAPPKGQLKKAEWNRFIKFVPSVGNLRRYYSDCLDVRACVAFLLQFSVEHCAATKGVLSLFAAKCTLLFMIAFRFFNRLSTFAPLRRAWMQIGHHDAEPCWDVMEDYLGKHSEKLFKQFARPPTYKTSQEACGHAHEFDLEEKEDVDIALMVNVFKSHWDNPDFNAAAEQLHKGIETPADWECFLKSLEKLGAAEEVKKTFGDYRRKNVCDLVVAMVAVPSSAIGRCIHPKYKNVVYHFCFVLCCSASFCSAGQSRI